MLGEVIRWLGARSEECFFWATHGGAELDLFVIRGKKRLGFEIKLTSQPEITPSMRNALKDLKLSHLWVLHGGKKSFAMDKKITAVAAGRILDNLRDL